MPMYPNRTDAVYLTHAAGARAVRKQSGDLYGAIGLARGEEESGYV